VGVKDENAKKYHEALEEGKFVVVAHGTQEEVNRALEIMDDHGKHDDIELH
jgi:hypothetical protein